MKKGTRHDVVPKSRGTPSLPVLRPLVAGIDVGSEQHFVAGPQRADGEPNVRVFSTTTEQLQLLADWLVEQGVESVAMESTHIYWIPVYDVLEARGLEVVLANARQLRNVPGRKTDYLDCQWIQLLHSCGLLRGSFRPDKDIAALRVLHRQKANLIAERTRYVHWMQKALDQMNIQVHRAVSDITGLTGMAIVRAIVAGERDAARLAEHRDPRCRKTAEEIGKYLVGTWSEEHLFNLTSALRLYDAIQVEICTYEKQIQEGLLRLQPPERKDIPVPKHPNEAKEKGIKRLGDQDKREAHFRLAGVDLTRIDGISANTAEIVLTEVGPNLSAFPSEKQFIAWLRLCPRVAISGGKPLKKKKNGHGANRVANALRSAAASLRNSKSALGALYRRICRKKSKAIAVFATARRLATLIYRMLRFGQDYVDAGEEAYEAQFAARRLSALRENARSLGYTLQSVEPRPAEVQA